MGEPLRPGQDLRPLPAHERREGAQHLADRRVHPGFEDLLPVRFRHEFTQADQRAVFRRRGGVAASRTGCESEVRTAFLADADHGKAAFCAFDGFRKNKAALIQAQMETDSFLLKPFRNLIGTMAGGFLGGGGREPDIPPGDISFPDQFIRRLEHGPQAAFVIQRAAAPEPAFRDFAGKGAVGPLTAGFHHVMVVHEQVRLRGRILSLPAKNESVREFRIFRVFK